MTPAQSLLVLAVFPLWSLAGFADWACHRRTDIARTSGLRENGLHWLMLALVVGGAALALFFEVTAGLLALLLLLFMLHEFTAAWDLSGSTLQRDVGPTEQLVHSFQELLPLLAIVLLALDAWPTLWPPSWALHVRSGLPPLPWLAAAGLLVLGLNLLPLLQETAACLGARRAASRRVSAREKAGREKAARDQAAKEQAAAQKAAADKAARAPAPAQGAPAGGRVEPGL